MSLPRLSHKNHCHFHFFSWLTHSGENQLPHHEDTQEALQRGRHGKELNPPVESLVGKLFWNWTFQCQPSLQMTAITANILLPLHERF